MPSRKTRPTLMYNQSMETTLSEMSVSQLRQLIREIIDEKLDPILDPDYGLEIRDEVRERLLRQMQEIKNGERGRSLDEVMIDLGIDRSELEAVADVPVTVSR